MAIHTERTPKTMPTIEPVSRPPDEEFVGNGGEVDVDVDTGVCDWVEVGDGVGVRVTVGVVNGPVDIVIVFVVGEIGAARFC
jgi:hypothetical protein